MTNWEYIKAAIDDEIDDDGASWEAAIYYHIECPHCNGQGPCRDVGYKGVTREMCVRCKAEWLEEEFE